MLLGYLIDSSGSYGPKWGIRSRICSVRQAPSSSH